MEGIRELVLIASLVVVCLFSMKIAHDSAIQAERITHQIELMFVKS